MSIDYVVSTTYRAKDEASGTAKKIGASFDNLDKTIASSMARVGGAIDAIGRMAVDPSWARLPQVLRSLAT